jgi:hypothetical protein
MKITELREGKKYKEVKNKQRNRSRKRRERGNGGK